MPAAGVGEKEPPRCEVASGHLVVERTRPQHDMIPLVKPPLAQYRCGQWNFFLLERWVFLYAKARRPLVRLISFATINNSMLLRIPLLVLLICGLHIFYLISNATILLVGCASASVSC
jgi:hypothetical protein